MTWPVTADPDRFEEAIAWFVKRFPVTDAILAALGKYAGDRAWTVAGVAQLDVVLDVFRSLERAITNATPLDQWKREIGEKLYAAWGKKDSARVETIFLTNVQSAYNAGRWRQVNDPLVVKARPFLGYDAILDDRTSPVCKRCNGAILPADDPWWQTHVPPLHHRCRSTIRSFTKREAERRGGVKHPGEDTEGDQPDEGFGVAPDIAEPWEPNLDKYPDDLRKAFKAKQKAATKAKPKKPPAPLPPAIPDHSTVPDEARRQAVEDSYRANKLSRNPLQRMLEADFGIETQVAYRGKGADLARRIVDEQRGTLTSEQAYQLVMLGASGAGPLTSAVLDAAKVSGDPVP
jgi:SPP1 gp7 family putative phage head morphogenesis protein